MQNNNGGGGSQGAKRKRAAADPADSAYSEEEHKSIPLPKKPKTDGHETQAPMNGYNTRPRDVVDEEE
jgi:hypothetical protein